MSLNRECTVFISSPGKSQCNNLKLSWKFDGSLCFDLCLWLSFNKSKVFQIQIFLLPPIYYIFSYFIFKCTQFGRKWLSPLCDELSSLFQQEKGFSSKEAIFLDFPANPNNGKILPTLSSLCIPCLIWQLKKWSKSIISQKLLYTKKFLHCFFYYSAW